VSATQKVRSKGHTNVTGNVWMSTRCLFVQFLTKKSIRSTFLYFTYILSFSTAFNVSPLTWAAAELAKDVTSARSSAGSVPMTLVLTFLLPVPSSAVRSPSMAKSQAREATIWVTKKSCAIHYHRRRV
jgi:hypothetical protein